MEISFINHAFNCNGMIIDGTKYPLVTNSNTIVTLDGKEHNITIINGNTSQAHLSIIDLITFKSVLMSGIIVSAECDYKFKIQPQEDCIIEITDNEISSISENFNYSSYRASSETVQIENEDYILSDYKLLKSKFLKLNFGICSALPLILVLIIAYLTLINKLSLLLIAVGLFLLCTVPSIARYKKFKDKYTPYETGRSLRTNSNCNQRRSKFTTYINSRL